MRKYLVFYPVDNELKLERHTFDLMTDEEAWKELQKLEGVRVYDLTRSDRNGRMLDLGDFVEDYNDEELDGGWWSTVLTLPDGQENEKKEWNYPREFKKNERVCYEDEHGTPYKAMVTHDQRSEYEEDEIELFIFLDEEDDDSQGIDTRKVKAREIYQLSQDGKTCPKCGESLYDEHLEHVDYPYYCPWCQENFYGIEVQ